MKVRGGINHYRHTIMSSPPLTTAEQAEKNAALVQAAFLVSLSDVQKLVEEGADVNGTESPNALGWALHNGDAEMANYLISKGARLDLNQCLPTSLKELDSWSVSKGGFELTLRMGGYELEKEDPQYCLETYCQDGSLNESSLTRLLKLGASVHANNGAALHLVFLEPNPNEKDLHKAKIITKMLIKHGAHIEAKTLDRPRLPIESAIVNGYEDAGKEILKHYHEAGLCKLISTHNDRRIINPATEEIKRRMRELPASTLERYTKIQGSHPKLELGVLSTFAKKETSRRKSEKLVKAISNKDQDNQDIEI